ncbi:MAG: hypothetical protein AMXMBFR56_12490 [Polyangiaceae bacterium]
MSSPRTFSRTSQKVSPSLKRDTRASPSGEPKTLEISCANSGFAFPVKRQIRLTATAHTRPLTPRKDE